MKDIRDISQAELTLFLKEQGEQPFRAKQISEWLWKKEVFSFEEMTNLSRQLRDLLQTHFSFKTTSILEEIRSKDKTTKFIFELHDGCQVEGVLIPSRERVTACISSQVGCPLGCRFCATGTMGFTRDLHHAEIIDQYVLMNRRCQDYFHHAINNIVYMGMGEPLLNIDHVMRSVELLTSPDGKGISPSRVTLSTAGLVKGITRLADAGFKAGLALSLHSADEIIRQQLMPVAKQNSLPELQEALQYFVQKTGSRITLEYLLLSHVNDSLQDAMKLARFCKAFPVKINIIEYNLTGMEFKPTPPEKLNEFVNYLESKNLIVNVRNSKGSDIAAACGQLVKKKKDRG